LRKNDLGVWRDSFLGDLRSVPPHGADDAGRSS
jgi:trehalose 6-phosphate synthase